MIPTPHSKPTVMEEERNSHTTSQRTRSAHHRSPALPPSQSAYQPGDTEHRFSPPWNSKHQIALDHLSSPHLFSPPTAKRTAFIIARSSTSRHATLSSDWGDTGRLEPRTLSALPSPTCSPAPFSPSSPPQEDTYIRVLPYEPPPPSPLRFPAAWWGVGVRGAQS